MCTIHAYIYTYLHDAVQDGFVVRCTVVASCVVPDERNWGTGEHENKKGNMGEHGNKKGDRGTWEEGNIGTKHGNMGTKKWEYGNMGTRC
jgi:hypothetical protein